MLKGSGELEFNSFCSKIWAALQVWALTCDLEMEEETSRKTNQNVPELIVPGMSKSILLSNCLSSIFIWPGSS